MSHKHHNRIDFSSSQKHVIIVSVLKNGYAPYLINLAGSFELVLTKQKYVLTVYLVDMIKKIWLTT